MRRQHKNHYQTTTKRKYIIPSVLGAVVVVGAIAAVLYGTLGRSTANAEKPVYVHHSAPSPFTYKKGGDWGHAIGDGQSLALFGKKDSQGMSPCFVSLNYQPGTDNGAAKKIAFMNKHAKKVTEIGSKALTMQTNEGVKHYTLSQFDVQSPAGEDPAMAGQEYGYVQLANGGVTVVGNCEQTDLLSTTIDALGDISFNTSKVTLEQD